MLNLKNQLNVFALFLLVFSAYTGNTYAIQADTTKPDTTDNCLKAKIEYYEVNPVIINNQGDSNLWYNPDSVQNGYYYHFKDVSGDFVQTRKWTISDGTEYTDKEFIHHFTHPGTYEICLTIFYERCFDQICITIVVGDTTPCQAKFRIEKLYIVNGNQDSTLMPNTPYAYQFIDLSEEEVEIRRWYVDNELIGSDEYQFYHFQELGNYTICLEIITADGCQSTICKEFFVCDSSACQAYFEYYPMIYIMDEAETSSFIIPTGYLYQFIDKSRGDVVDWYWSFAADSFYHEKNPVYEFPGPGTYEVCLTIVTSNGCQSTFCKNVIIEGGNECHAIFEYYSPVDSLGIEPNFPNNNAGLIQFHDVSQGNISAWNWDFGDGTYSQNQHPMHNFDPGVYQVCLTIYTEDGCSDTFCEYIYIDSTNLCNAYFEYCKYDHISPISSVQPSKYLIGFKNMSTPYYSQVEWDFGDSTGSNQINPIHDYGQAGIYNVCLTIWSPDGCTDIYCKEVNVGNVYCSVDFNYEVYFPRCTGFEPIYAFVPVVNGTVTNYIWTFGDGSVSYDAEPNHTYANEGVYEVCLEVTYNNNCTAQTCDIIYNNMDVLDSVYSRSCAPTSVSGINSKNELLITGVYPVPSSEDVTIKLSSSSEQSASIKLINIYGQTVLVKNEYQLYSGDNEIVINLTDIHTGEYMYIITTANKVLNGKVSIIK